ncbi:MAG: ATP-binding protein [Actinomycetota bacterium]|nr:ATP-binding protein [Actinomycetota bacterium]
MRRLLMFSRHIKVRLTLWYVFLLAVVLIIFSVVLYMSLRGSLINEIESSLLTMSEQIASSLDYENGRLSFQNEGEPDNPLDRLASQGYVMRLTDATGETIEGVGPYRDVLDKGMEFKKGFQASDALGNRWQVYTLMISTGPEHYYLQVGQSLGRVDSTLSKLLFFELITVPLVLVLAIAMGIFLAGRALRPVEKITQIAGSIEAVDLNRRLDLDLPDDELGRLAKTFDDMLARLEEGFSSQKRFVSEAAHELRTPLTVMKGTTEVCLKRERECGEYEETLKELEGEIDHLIAIAEDLLTLSSANSERPTMDVKDLDLHEIVRSAVELIGPLAESKGMNIRFKAKGSIPFRGDRNKLIRMFLNLLDNAVKYSPPGSAVSVSISHEGQTITVAIKDSGHGIGRDEIDSIFQSFHRLDQAREANPSGAGLGLSIALWLARAHNGDIRVESDLGKGSTFKVILPHS